MADTDKNNAEEISLPEDLPEQAARDAAEIHRALAEATQDMIFEVGLDGLLTYVNSCGARAFGATSDKLVGKSLNALFPEQTQLVLSETIGLVMATGGPISRVERVALPGRETWLDTTLVPRKNKDGVIAAIMGISRDVTERILAEQALRKVTERLAEAQQVGHVGSWECNAIDDVVIGSEEVFRLFEVEPSQLACRADFFACLHPDDLKRLEKAFADALVRDRAYYVEYRVRQRDGGWRNIAERSQVFVDGQGRPTRIVGTCIDITEREEAARRIAEEERKAKAFLQGTKDLVTIVDPNGRFLYVNASARDFLGAEPAALIGRRAFDFVHPDDRATTRGAFEGWLRDKVASASLENRQVSGEGRVRHTLWTIMPQYGTDGELYEIWSIARDITEHKQAEDALRTSEATLRQLTESLPHLVWTCLADGSCDFLSRQWIDYTGIPEAEQLGYGWLAQLHPADRERVKAEWAATVGAQKAFDIEFRIRRFDGVYRWFKTRAVPLQDGSGKLLKWFGSNTDIEELRQLAYGLARSNLELEQFAYVASHDLQEPLRMVSSYTQLLAKRYQDRLDQDARDFIAYAVDGANRMQRLIQDLLCYSRVSTRGQSLKPLDAHDPLGEAIANLRAAIQETGALVSNGELPRILGDHTQIAQIFQNLIGNALKFRKPDEAPRVHVSATQHADPADFWTFCVRDNGIGIEPRHFERLFVIFQRLHGKMEYPGTGVGLALCKRIVERHGGKIWLESEPGRGTTFFFTLPSAGMTDRKRQ